MKLTDIVDLSRMHELKPDDIYLAHITGISREEALAAYLGMNPFIDEMNAVIDFHVETANYADLDTLFPTPATMALEVADHIEEKLGHLPIMFKAILYWETMLNLRNYGAHQMHEKIILHNLKKDNGTKEEPSADTSGD